MRLDFSRPYAEVCGRVGVAYEQDGHNFRVDGSCIDDAPHQATTYVLPPEVEAKFVEQIAAEQTLPAPKRTPRKQALRADTILRHQYGDMVDEESWALPRAPQRDVLAAYRDPQAADGSMVVEAKVWVDGI